MNDLQLNEASTYRTDGGDEEQVGFVCGVVSEAITEAEREQGKVGHTVQQWLAYNDAEGGSARRYYLRDNHGKRVGRLLHTYVNHEGQLCAAGLLDKQYPELWTGVRDGSIHSFSIGFDAIPVRNAEDGTWTYKNEGFEVSLTSRPRKPFARIQVRCSEPEMSSESNTSPVPSPPSSSSSSPMDTSSATETPKPQETTAEAKLIAEAQEKARMFDELMQSKQKKKMQKRLDEITPAKDILKEEGMDMDNEGEQQVLSAIAQTQSKLPTAMNRLAVRATTAEQDKKRLQEENTKLQQRLAEQERELAQRSALMGLVNQYRSTPTPSSNPLQSLLHLDKSLFAQAERCADEDAAKMAGVKELQQAQQTQRIRASEAAANSLTGDAESGAVEEQSMPRIEIPIDPCERVNWGFQLAGRGIPLPQHVRCSSGQEPPVCESVRQRCDQYGLRHDILPDPYVDAMFSNEDYWKKRQSQMGGLYEDGIAPGHKSWKPAFKDSPFVGPLAVARRSQLRF